MHILLLPSWYPFQNNNAGLFIAEQAKALSCCPDLRISIINWGPNEFVLKLRKLSQIYNTIQRYRSSKSEILHLNNNLTEYRIPHLTWTSHIGKGNYPSLAHKMLKQIELIKKEFGKIDIIHAHQTFPAGFIAYNLSRYLSVPYIITEHSCPFPFREFKTPFGIRKMMLTTLANAAAVIAVSNWLAGLIKSYIDIPVIVLPNSVDTDFFKPSSYVVGEKSSPIIFSMTQPIKRKGIDILIQAVKLLKSKDCNFVLKIGGDGNKLSYYKHLAEKYEVKDRLEWLGYLNREKALPEYQNCDFVVMPSRLESLSMVILEALACGKPVVATACGGPQDLINSANGILVEPDNPSALAEGIEFMLKNYNSYQAEKIREDCLNRFSDAAVTAKLEQIYNQVKNRQIS